MAKSKKNPSATSRKLPVQERSRHTVQAILEATSQVLVANGYEGTTTGAVVERAGVSIGTLYQYFPNREALIARLIETHVDGLVTTVGKALKDNIRATPEELLRAVIRASIEAHRVEPELHKVIIEQVPREGYLAEALGLSRRLSLMLHDELQRRFKGLPVSRLRMVAFMLETTIEALTHRAVIEGPSWLKTGELESEAVRLLVPYLAEVSDRSGAAEGLALGA